MSGQEPMGHVTIGAREIYDLLVDVRAQLARLTDQHQETRDDLRDHETRIRVVEQTGVSPKAFEELASRVTGIERTRWPLPSLAALVSIAALILAWLNFKPLPPF